jgi:hypothetical protein
LTTYICQSSWTSTSFALIAVLTISAILAGCGGGSPDCTVMSLNIGPPTAAANHLAASPGSQAVFVGFDNLGALPSACFGNIAIAQAMRLDLKWTVSDSVNVTIGNTQGVDYGVATCHNATAGPVTITATGPNAKGATISGTASLTCN